MSPAGSGWGFKFSTLYYETWSDLPSPVLIIKERPINIEWMIIGKKHALVIFAIGTIFFFLIFSSFIFICSHFVTFYLASKLLNITHTHTSLFHFLSKSLFVSFSLSLSSYFSLSDASIFLDLKKKSGKEMIKWERICLFDRKLSDKPANSWFLTLQHTRECCLILIQFEQAKLCFKIRTYIGTIIDLTKLF